MRAKAWGLYRDAPADATRCYDAAVLRSPLVLALAIAACDPPPPPADPWARPARELLAEVRARVDDRWPEAKTIRGIAPHGAYSTVRLDPTAEAARTGEPREHWPEGATFVCEGSRDEAGDEPIATMLLVRRDGAWLWAQYDAAGEPLEYGHATSCVHCHQAGSDFVRSVSLPK